MTLGATGTADSASFLALILRARWAVQAFGVQLTYVKHSPAADAYLARLLALLDSQNGQLASLPPHFTYTKVSRASVDESIAYVFGRIKDEGCQRAAPFLLASLLHHFNYLKEKLPRNHPLWNSSFGHLTAQQIQVLREDISMENIGTAVQLPAIGVPIATSMMAEQKQLRKEIQAQQSMIQDLQAGMRDIARAIPTSELSTQWSAGIERANQWGSLIESKIEVTIDRALKKAIPSNPALFAPGSTDDRPNRYVAVISGI